MVLFEAVAGYIAKALVTLLDVFLDAFVRWVAVLPSILKEVVAGRLIGCKTFVDTRNNEEVSKNYSLQPNGQWQLTTLSRKVNRSEIPSEYLNQSTDMVDVTQELEMTLH